MILIADSGSTKTSWCFIDKNRNTTFYSTKGINPFFMTPEEITAIIKKDLSDIPKAEASHIYFYGAGIINKEKGKIVEHALEKTFPNAQLFLFSDLLAAAHSTLGKSAGIACILGTGSNSCYYDGKTIKEHVPPLGYILGDEGSGASLGRKLLADYLKGIMPSDLSDKFKTQFPFDYPEFMEKVYRMEKPNQFMASFVPFLKENINHKYCTEIIEESFNDFIKRNISRYTMYKEVPITFVGSVAWHFQDNLKIVLENHQLQLNKVLKEPLDGLISFYNENK